MRTSPEPWKTPVEKKLEDAVRLLSSINLRRTALTSLLMALDRIQNRIKTRSDRPPPIASHSRPISAKSCSVCTAGDPACPSPVNSHVVSPRNRCCLASICLLYTSDAADDLLCVDLGGRR